jgi:putative molybdopterin biosynthesis protein
LERRIFRRMVSVDEVLPLIETYRTLKPLGEVELPLTEAIGRVLSRNIFSPTNYPPYTRATVDGYAVISEDLAGAYEDRPRSLKLVGKVSTGETRLLRLERGQCVEVSTGAVVPYPADAVVLVEHTHARNGEIEFYRSVAKGENIDAAGSDIAEGEVVAWRGSVVSPLLASLLAAVGIDRVWVYRPVRLGIIPTGDELKSPGEELEYGQIYDSNSTMIYAYAKAVGAEPKIYSRVHDVLEEIEEAIRKALEENDVVATIGGTSAGIEDKTYRVLSKLNPGIILHGVREKPGRPLAVAVHEDKIVFALPGFPLSCLLTVNLYLIPVLLKLQGITTRELAKTRALLSTPLRGEPGIRVFVPAILRGGEKPTAYPLAGHSGRVSLMMLLDGYIVIPEDSEYLPEGSEVEVLVNPFQKSYEVNIIGSHDPLLQSIVAELPSHDKVRVVNVGSLSGLQALKSGVADIAGTHLLDPETGEYNLPIIRQLDIKNAVLLVGYRREQGFVYRKNAEPISSFKDIIDRKLRFINRNPGSGTRVLIDHLLEQEAAHCGTTPEELKNKLTGYTFEVKTHEAVAYLISRGVGDVGIAVKYIADKYNLGFTPIVSERYDLTIRKESLAKEIVSKIVENVKKLRSRDLPTGYILEHETGRILEI